MKKSEINILIVDDDKTSGLVLTESIKRMGFNPHHTLRAEDALQVIKVKHIHCAIIDVLLPKTSGVDLAMEFRNSRFGGAPIILISGIFKDKTFAGDSIRKTNAVDFLFKPFSFADLSKTVLRALEPILSMENWTVSSLLTHRLNSQRDKIKAIERLGDVHGFHLPALLSLLLDSEATGHVNIVDDQEQIFGITINEGKIVSAESKASEGSLIKALIEKGYLSAADASHGKNDVDYFLREGFVSPHAFREVKREHVYGILDVLSQLTSLQINFVPITSLAEKSVCEISSEQFIKHIVDRRDIYLNLEKIREFYGPVLAAPIRAVKAPLEIADADIEAMVIKGLSIEEGVKFFSKSADDLLWGVHLAFLARKINFDDLAKVKSLDTLLERFERLYTEFKIRQPHEIFEYFGADPALRVADILRIYNEYSEANHPDRLPKGASADLKRLCTDCYEMLTDAYKLLASDQSRAEYDKGLRAQHGERQAYVHNLSEEALDHLRRGQAQSALSMFREANKILPSIRLQMLCIWADIKAQGAKPDREILNKALQQLEGMNPEEKKAALYFMVLGLVKRSLGDGKAAQGCFEKALVIEPTFVEARRELNSIQTQVQGAKKFDLFNDDITDVVSQIFRRKKS